MTNLRVGNRNNRDNSSELSLDNLELRRTATVTTLAASNPSRTSPARPTGGDGGLSKLFSSAIVHALEALLAAVLSPLTMWQWLSSHDHFMVVLKIVIEVLLELIMLIVFAGVSILTAAALVLEDAYDEKAPSASNETEGKAQGKAPDVITDFSSLTSR